MFVDGFVPVGGFVFTGGLVPDCGFVVPDGFFDDGVSGCLPAFSIPRPGARRPVLPGCPVGRGFAGCVDPPPAGLPPIRPPLVRLAT